MFRWIKSHKMPDPLYTKPTKFKLGIQNNTYVLPKLFGMSYSRIWNGVCDIGGGTINNI